MKLLFLITVIKSRGEAYLALKAAKEVVSSGGECRFIAMPEVADFIEDNGFKTIRLTTKKEENKKLIDELFKEFKPSGFVYASYRNLNLGIGIGKVFESEWIDEQNILQATFDPENYPRDKKKIASGPLIDRTYRLPEIPDSMKTISTDIKEDMRSPENTFFYRFNVIDQDKKALRKKYGWKEDRPVIIFPISRWIYDNTVLFGSSYYKDFLPNLIAYYLTLCEKPVTICVVGEKELFVNEKWGNIDVEQVPVINIEEYEKRLAAADMLLTDNGMSGSIEIATQVETPVLVLKNSLKANLNQGQIKTEAAFELTPYVQEVMKMMLEENSKAIFPFAIYPLGWWDIVENLFKKNPLHNTFCEAELFDERSVINLLKQLLWDKKFNKKIQGLQKEYKEKQRDISGFSEVAELIFR